MGGSSIVSVNDWEFASPPNNVKTLVLFGQTNNELFDLSAKSIGEEILKCIGLAKDGIHSIIVVLSIKTRFSVEEENALRSLQILFGSKIVDYMIVVFTNGDALENDDLTLDDDYLGHKCPEPLKEIISLCHNRYVLFDNIIKDKENRFKQVQQLLSLVNQQIGVNQVPNEKLPKILEKMRENGCSPNVVTYTIMLLGYDKAGKLRKALEAYERMKNEE
ncbi:hypothetical protein RYX36_004161 [Vicia faba]